MHGMSVRNGFQLIAQVVIVCSLAGVALYQGYYVRKREIYRKFYENYDADKEFERMRKKNLFNSC